MNGSLFDRNGGFAFVSRLTMTFYDRVLDDDLVAHHFEGIDLPRLIDHQTRFLASLLGGPAAYSDAHLGEVHRRLAVTHEEFDALLAVLGETLDEHRFAPADRDAVLRAFEARRSVIVPRARS